MKREYSTAPKFAELPDSDGSIFYYILYTDNGKRKRQRAHNVPCRCNNNGSRFCEHKARAMRLFEEFEQSHEAKEMGKEINLTIADLLDNYLEYSKANKIHGERTFVLVSKNLDKFFNFCIINKID